MTAIAVDLVANDEISASALAASKAMRELAKQEERVAAVAGKLGTTDLTRVGKAISLVERRAATEERAAVRVAAIQRRESDKIARLQDALHLKAMKAKASDEKKAEALARKAIQAREKADKKRIETVKKLKSGNVAEALGLGATGLAVGVVAVGLLAAGAAALGIAGALGSAAAEAGKLKASATAAMNVLTAGRGSEALALVDGLAVKLGLNIGKAREAFIGMRQAGADNATSAAMLKLIGDLDSVDRTGKLSAAAVEKVLAHKRADGTLDIKAARAEMALLAKQAGVAGTGADAAAARFTTLGGALSSLDNSKTQFLERVWDRIGPTIDRAAGSVARWADAFLSSERGAAFIDGIGNAFESLISGVGKAASIASSFVDTLIEWAPVLEAVAVGATAAGVAFLATMVPAIIATGTAMAAALVPIVVAAAPFIAIAAGAALVYTAFKNLPAIIGFLSDTFSSFTETALGAGRAIVDGLIAGLASGGGFLIDKVKGLASASWKAFKETLGIASPSKAFAELGDFSGQGFGVGFERSLPDSGELASDMLPDGKAVEAQAMGAVVPSAQSGGQTAPAPAGDTIFNINVNGSGLSSDDLTRSIRREIDLAFLARLQSRGRA